MSDSTTGGPGDGDRRALRQQRLQRLRGGAGGAAGGADDEGQAKRRRALGRVVKILTETPDDGRGTVEGTRFTQAGVGALMAQLGNRAGQEGSPGAKVANRLMELLRPEGDEAVVEGASVSKLQRLARLARGANRAGAPGGGGAGGGGAGGGRRRRQPA